MWMIDHGQLGVTPVDCEEVLDANGEKWKSNRASLGLLAKKGPALHHPHASDWQGLSLAL